MLWLALCLSRLPLEVFLRAGAGPCLAVFEGNHVVMASSAAQALGVRPGIKRATALALAPALQLHERDRAREHRSLCQIACWASQFTPQVSLQQPAEPARSGQRAAPEQASGLLLEIGASLRLFGGHRALVVRARSGLAELGVSAQLACAPTATGAWLLARHHDGAFTATQAQLNARLAPVPVAVLEAACPHLATLESIGARTLGDLAQLPRAGLARRFGHALLAELDRAFARSPEPRRWFEAPAAFESRLELLAQVENAEALLFAAQRLIAQLGGWLGARHAAVRAFTLVCESDAAAPLEITLRLAEASRDPARLLVLVRERLPLVRLAAPVHTIALRCDEVSPLAAGNAELFPVPASARESLGRLIERLQARLGRGQVQRLLVAADHRPEAAYRSEPVDDLSGFGGGGAHATPVPDPIGALPRPLWLLEPPVALTERNNRPFWHGPLTLLAGPERIESGWWDNALVQRDYFIAADESSALLWIYRERVAQPDNRRGWFIQGRFG
ncbi:MAG TPA: DNA polymerase Y family protein [Burkholderiaceae bacterium]